jgi:hypothetical protein
MPTFGAKCLLVRNIGGLIEAVFMLDDNGPDEWKYRENSQSNFLTVRPFEGEQFKPGAHYRLTYVRDD